MSDLTVTGTIIATNPVDDYIALTMRHQAGNKQAQIQAKGDDNITHSALVFKQTAPTTSGNPTDSRLEVQTMDGGTLAARLTITEDAKVLVGSPPVAPGKLNVHGSLSLNDQVDDFAAIVMRPNDGNKTSRIQAAGDSGTVHTAIVAKQVAPTTSGTPTDSRLELQTMDGGTLATRLTIDENARVGIGNTSPQAPLHVGAGADAPASSNVVAHFSNAGATTLTVRDSTNDVEAMIRAESGAVTLGAASFHPLRLKAQTIDVMYLSVTGVGIGNTAPGAGLDVSGRIRARGSSSDATFTDALNLAVKSLGSGGDSNPPGLSFHGDNGDLYGSIKADQQEMDFHGPVEADAPGVTGPGNFREMRLSHRWLGVGGWERSGRTQDGIVNFVHHDWKGRWVFGVVEDVEDTAVTMLQAHSTTFRLWTGTIAILTDFGIDPEAYITGKHICVKRGDHVDIDVGGDGNEIIRFDITTDTQNYMRVYRTAGTRTYHIVYAGVYS